MSRLSVKRGLLLRRGKRPRSARAGLLAKHESQLLWRAELRLVGTERRARLGQIEGAQEVLAEEAFLAADLPRRTAGWSFALLARHLSPFATQIDGTRRSKHRCADLTRPRRGPLRKSQRKDLLLAVTLQTVTIL